MSLKALELVEVSRKQLETIVRRGENWRERERAQTLLLMAEGLSRQAVAEELGLHVRTVGSTRRAWLAGGLDTLGDLPRSGAPRKLRPEHVEHVEHVERIVEWAVAEPLTAAGLMARHNDAGGPQVHLNTLVGTHQGCRPGVEAGAVLFEKSRHEAAFRHAAVDIEALRARAAAGEIVLAYADEVGFVQAHPLRSAWTRRGSEHRHLIEAKRGKRLNVLGALLSTGELFCTRLWQTWTANLFVGWLGLLKEHVGCALTVIIDNAPIHTAKKSALNNSFFKRWRTERGRVGAAWR